MKSQLELLGPRTVLNPPKMRACRAIRDRKTCGNMTHNYFKCGWCIFIQQRDESQFENEEDRCVNYELADGYAFHAPRHG